MEHNILDGAICTVNTTEGNKSVPYSYLYSISDYSDTPLMTLSGVDVLVIEYDLGYRIHLDRFEYKFEDPLASAQAVASGVEFYYKDESFEGYISLATMVSGTNIFYSNTSASGITFAPRYLKLKHTLADTDGGPTTSGNLYGFRAINNDTVVDFGSDALKASESIDVARGATAEIRAIPIYNSGTTLADAFINVEPTFTNIDDALSVAISEDGPWTKALDEGEVKLDSDNLDHGVNSNTEVSNDRIRITSIDTYDSCIATGSAYGSYTSPVFRKDDSASYARVIIDKLSGYSGQIVVDAGDPAETVEIRTHNTKPKTYAVIRELYDYLDSTYKVAYRDRWLDTQEIKESSTWYIGSCSIYTRWKGFGIVFDQNTERWAGWATHDGDNPSNGFAELYLFNCFKTDYSYSLKLATQTTRAAAVNSVFKELKIDAVGGMWLYFYCQSYSASEFVDNTGYYLAYFDEEFTNVFKWYDSEEHIGNLDVNYDNSEIWYTRPPSSAIYRLDTAGTILLEFTDADYTGNLGGIAVLPDDNIIFGNYTSLYRLHYSGYIIESYSIEDVAETSVDYIALDPADSSAAWIIDGLTVGRLFISGDNMGEWDFRVENLGYPIRMQAVEGGVWIKCSQEEVTGTTYMKFISKENRRVDVSYVQTYDSFPALIYQTYENINYTSKMPLGVDNYWDGLSWSKIATESYLLSEDDYYQLKITLQRPAPYENWPTFVTDPYQSYEHNDYFTQSSATPKQYIWSDWTNYPETDYVYVDTISGGLILSGDYIGDSYINTNGRVVYSLADTTDELEMIMSYKFGDGNGIVSGKLEQLFIYMYSTDPGAEGNYLAVGISVPTNPVTGATILYIRRYISGDYYTTSASLGTGTNHYEGEIRFYYELTNERFWTGWRAAPGDSWTSVVYTSAYESQVGRNFYIKIVHPSEGSNAKVNHIYSNKGKIYYCSGSPIITSVYEQKLLELSDIYPNNYKNMYLKSFVPRSLDVSDSHNMDIKVRWRVASS